MTEEKSDLTTRLATFLATGFGSGYSPFAPGTAGSLVGLVLLVPLRRAGLGVEIGCLVLFTALGIAAGTLVARRLGLEDPSIVVVDEIVGMWVSLLFLPLTWTTAIVGFILFRIMDVVKPLGIRRLGDLPGGWGVVFDDLAAGLAANLLLQLMRCFYSF